MKLDPGTTIERYVVDQAIGAGGTAMVYRIVHSTLKTSFALKVLTITSENIRNRILLEGQVQASLRHINIVAVTDVLDVDGSPGLVMEYIEGPSLERALRRYQLAMRDAETLFLGVVSGVSHAHSHGLVHRDLKPANVLLASSSSGYIPKVTDFGLAKVLQGEGADTGQTRSGIAMGTPSYMSPEQIQDARNVDQRADIFSLGCILYELLTRRRAFPGEQALPIYNAICSGKYIDPKTILPNLPRRLEMAVGGALMVDRDARIPDCETLIRVFKGEQEWEIEDDSPRLVPALDAPIEAPSVALNAPILTISDGVSKQPASRPEALAGGLMQGSELVDADPGPDSDLGLYMEPVTDSISDAIDPVTLLPETGEKKVSYRVIALLVLVMLLAGSWASMAVVYVGWVTSESASVASTDPVIVEDIASQEPEKPERGEEPAVEVAQPTVQPSPPISVAPSTPQPVAVPPAPIVDVQVVGPRPAPVETSPPATSTVKILSIPPTAKVQVNGEERGRTPAKLDLSDGSYEIQLQSGDAGATFKISVGEGNSNKWCYNFTDGRRYEGSCPR